MLLGAVDERFDNDEDGSDKDITTDANAATMSSPVAIPPSSPHRR